MLALSSVEEKAKVCASCFLCLPTVVIVSLEYRAKCLFVLGTKRASCSRSVLCAFEVAVGLFVARSYFFPHWEMCVCVFVYPRPPVNCCIVCSVLRALRVLGVSFVM